MAATGRVLAGVAAVAVAAVEFLYIQLIAVQGGPDPAGVWVVRFIVGYLALMAVLLTVSVLAPAGYRAPLRAAPAFGLFVLGVLAMFSIGIALIVCAVLAGISAFLDARGEPKLWPVTAAGVFAAVAVVALLAGMQVASRQVVCPPSGQMSGSTGGLFGSVSYECDNGRLTLR